MTPIQMSYRIWPVVILESLVFLIVGFSLLVFSGDKLVEASVQIAKKWNIPASVIAATIIAAGTSAPEFVTSFLAGYRGSSDISIGNLIGSNIFNILGVGGLSLILQSKMNMSSTRMTWFVLCLCTIIFYYFLVDFTFSHIEAYLFIFLLLAFITLSFWKKTSQSDSEEVDAVVQAPMKKSVLLFIFSNIGLIVGAEIALRGGVSLGSWAGLSERVIAITIISVGTGLPELATSIAAAYRGHGDVAIANVIGSNIFNTLAIPAGTASFFAIQVSSQFLGWDFWVMSGATIAIGVLYLFKNQNFSKLVGAIFFVSYISYVANLIMTQ